MTGIGFPTEKKVQEKLSEMSFLKLYIRIKINCNGALFDFYLYLCDKSIKVSTNEKDIKTKCLITFTIDSIMTSIVKRVKQSNDIDIYFLNIY